jgi:Fe2+ transport system protein FeoA
MESTKTVPLSKLAYGERAIVCSVSSSRADRFSRLLAFGLVEGSEVCVRGAAPLGDPINVISAGTEISLRREDASGIQVRRLQNN